MRCTGGACHIAAGPFQNMEGTVSTMNDQTQTADVLINLFGRETPATDISYNDIEKVVE